ncbi:hypothetical protein D3C87_1683120 [compost metagenome]
MVNREIFDLASADHTNVPFCFIGQYFQFLIEHIVANADPRYRVGFQPAYLANRLHQFYIAIMPK